MKALLRWSWGVGPEEQELGHEVGKKLFERLKTSLGEVYGAGLREELSDHSPFGVTAHVCAGETEVRLRSELLVQPADEAGSIGGEAILTIPDDENGHKLADFLKQEDFFSDLDLKGDSEVRGWGPRLTNLGVEVDKLPDNLSLKQRLENSGWSIEQASSEFLKARRSPWHIAVHRGEKIVVKSVLTEDLRERLKEEGLFPLVRELIQIIQ